MMRLFLAFVLAAVSIVALTVTAPEAQAGCSAASSLKAANGACVQKGSAGSNVRVGIWKSIWQSRARVSSHGTSYGGEVSGWKAF